MLELTHVDAHRRGALRPPIAAAAERRGRRALRETCFSHTFSSHLLTPPRAFSAALFETSCFDGGFTGNRYLMVKNMLALAACCAGVAVLPPSFDGMPPTGAACFDFSALRHRAVGSNATLPTTHELCTGASSSSKFWWRRNVKEVPPSCAAHHAAARAAAALYAGAAFVLINTSLTPH